MATNTHEDMFAGVGSAPLMDGDRTPNLESGNYLVGIDETVVVTSTNPRTKGARYAIVNAKVLEAEPGSMTPVGMIGKISLAETRLQFDSEVKTLIAAVSDTFRSPEDLKKIDQKLTAEFFSSNPKAQEKLKGKKFKVRVNKVKTKADHDFYKYTFSPAI